MTILQVNKFFYRRGGADHHFLDLIDLLEAKGERVLVFSMKDRRNQPSVYNKYFVSNAEYGQGGLKALLSAGRLIYSREAKKNITALIRDEKPDVAHLHLIYHHLSPSVLVALRQMRVPAIMTIHDWKPICPAYSLFTEGLICERCRGGKYIECFNHRCIKNSRSASLLASIEAYIHHAKKYYEDYIDLMIAPSDFVRQKFIDFGWSKEKIRVLPHFLPLNFPRAIKPPPIPVEKRFAYIGRLSPEKGVDRLVNYWISHKCPYVLEIFGDGPLKNSINNQIKKSGQSSHIMMHGLMSRENIFASLDNITAIIMPSISYETFGLTAIESFARGIPAIMNDRGAFSELAHKSNAGILFDWDNDNLESAMLMSNNMAYRENAISYINSFHSADDYFKKIMNIYTELAVK